MRFKDFKITESSGVTNRNPGEIYISDENPDNHLVLVQVYLLPADDPAYATHEEMIAAVKDSVPTGEELIEENKPKSNQKAAILAHWSDHEGVDQYRVKYVQNFDTGPHNKYIRPNGYKYAKSAQQESVPIKPADLIDPSPRPVAQLGPEIKKSLDTNLAGTEYNDIIPVLTTAVELAERGQVSPIEDSAKYANVIAKYAGEYLGVIGIIQGGIRKGDFDKAMEFLGNPNLSNALVSFPDDKAGELIDSELQLPGGETIGISTKMKKGGGKASSLSGVYALMTDEIRQQHPESAEYLELLATAPATTKNISQVESLGIMRVASKLGILSEADFDAIKNLSSGSRDIEELQGNNNIYKITKQQGVDPKSYNSPAYRVMFHCWAAVANEVIKEMNGPKYKDFRDLIKSCLANNNYIQFLTDVRKSGDKISLDYTSKFPAVFDGEPKLFNANYYATGQKGRLGFKLK